MLYQESYGLGIKLGWGLAMCYLVRCLFTAWNTDKTYLGVLITYTVNIS